MLADAGVELPWSAAVTRRGPRAHAPNRACARASGRAEASITLIAVSKTAARREARATRYAAGQRVFGENYAQELRDKRARQASRTPSWHFIGALQSNKAKLLAGKVALVHTCDRLSLAKELSKRAGRSGCCSR